MSVMSDTKGVVRTWRHAGCSTEHHSPVSAQRCWVGRQPVQVTEGGIYRSSTHRRDGRLMGGLFRRLRPA